MLSLKAEYAQDLQTVEAIAQKSPQMQLFLMKIIKLAKQFMANSLVCWSIQMR